LGCHFKDRSIDNVCGWEKSDPIIGKVLTIGRQLEREKIQMNATFSNPHPGVLALPYLSASIFPPSLPSDTPHSFHFTFT
jgi:hypothetical protein